MKKREEGKKKKRGGRKNQVNILYSINAIKKNKFRSCYFGA